MFSACLRTFSASVFGRFQRVFGRSQECFRTFFRVFTDARLAAVLQPAWGGCNGRRRPGAVQGVPVGRVLARSAGAALAAGEGHRVHAH